MEHHKSVQETIEMLMKPRVKVAIRQRAGEKLLALMIHLCDQQKETTKRLLSERRTKMELEEALRVQQREKRKVTRQLVDLKGEQKRANRRIELLLRVIDNALNQIEEEETNG